MVSKRADQKEQGSPVHTEHPTGAGLFSYCLQPAAQKLLQVQRTEPGQGASLKHTLSLPLASPPETCPINFIPFC